MIKFIAFLFKQVVFAVRKTIYFSDPAPPVTCEH